MLSVIMNINFLMDLLSVTIKIPDFSYIAQSGRAGRAGTKVGRLMRIVRMIRMIRVAKFYKAAKKAIEERRRVLKRNENENVKHKDKKTKFVSENNLNILTKRKPIFIKSPEQRHSFYQKIQSIQENINKEKEFSDSDLLSSHLSKIEIPNNKKILKEKSFLKKKADFQNQDHILSEKQSNTDNKLGIRSIGALSRNELNDYQNKTNERNKAIIGINAAKQIESYKRRNSFSFAMINKLSSNTSKFKYSRKLNNKELNANYQCISKNESVGRLSPKINNFQKESNNPQSQALIRLRRMSEIKKLPSENGSIISAKISEVEEEDKNSNSNKSKSSEFDINKTPSSSHDEPSNNEIEEEIKYVDKRKTSASTKEIKNNMAGVIQRRHRHSSHNRNISLMNESSQIIRNSAANSSLSFTSNKTFDNKIIDVSISKNEIKESKVSK